jgi:hypothetical protein
MLNRKFLSYNEDKENQNPEVKNDKKKLKPIVVESTESAENRENKNDSISMDLNNNNITTMSINDTEEFEPNTFSPAFNKELHELNNYLQQVNSCGEYLIEGRANEMPALIGLEIKDFGTVQLPFMFHQGKKLIETFQNKDAPKTSNFCELEPSKIEIKNPEWKVKLDELVARVAKALRCYSECEARLKKVLVYKSGLNNYRLAKKEEGVFGTLVVQLPSKCVGGELVVNEIGGESKSKKVVDFGHKEGQNEFAYYFAAFYTDLEQELLEVKKGYRMALIYSLCLSDGNLFSGYLIS